MKYIQIKKSFFAFLICYSSLAYTSLMDTENKQLKKIPAGSYSIETQDGRARIKFPVQECITFIQSEEQKKTCETSNNFGVNCSKYNKIQPEFVHAVSQYSNTNVLLKIFEIGCGTGYVLDEILEKCTPTQKIHYHAMDINPDMLTHFINKVRAKKAKGNHITLKWQSPGDICDFVKHPQFTEKHAGQYDKIYCSQVLHYLSFAQQLDVFQGINAMLKKNGQLYIIQNSIFSIGLWAPFSLSSSTFNQQTAYDIATTFETDITHGHLDAGYIVHKGFTMYRVISKARGNIPMLTPTLHSERTLRGLLSVFGFDVIECGNFSDAIFSPEQNGYETYSPYLGAIAQKRAEPDLDTIAVYKEQNKAREEALNVIKSGTKMLHEMITQRR